MPISIHLPNIRMAILRPSKNMPSNQAIFRMPRYLNKYDIRNYLQAVYNVRAIKIGTVIEQRRRVQHSRPDFFQRHPSQRPFVLTTMFKKAFVTFDEQSCADFKFPPLPRGKMELIDQEKKRREKKEAGSKQQGKAVNEQWDAIMAERYGEARDTVVIGDDACEPLSEPLANLTLDPAAVVKGQAKRRLQPKKKKNIQEDGEDVAAVSQSSEKAPDAAKQ
jgi:ribosomal protein L23